MLLPLLKGSNKMIGRALVAEAMVKLEKLSRD